MLPQTSVPQETPPKLAKTVGFALTVFAIIAGLFVAALVVLSLLISREVTVANNTKEKVASMLGEFNEIAQLNQKRPIAAALRTELEKALPLEIDVPTRIFPLIRALAQQYGFALDLRLGSATPGAIPSGGGYTFSATADTGLLPLTNFLSAVEGLETVVKIEQWSLVPSSAGYHLVFSGTIFTRSQ